MPEITIFDEIGLGNLTSQAFNESLKALGDAKDILVRINSPGGDVNDGIGIYTALKTCPAKITCRVEGIAASAASLIAMAADTIEMSSGTFMLVHEPHMMTTGTSDDLEAAAADLERLTESFVSIYAERSGMAAEAVLALMKEDRLMSAEEAVNLGFADTVVTTAKAKINMKRLPHRLSAAVWMAKHRGNTKMANEKNDDLKARMEEQEKKIDALLARAAAEDEEKEEAKARAKARKAKAEEDDPDMNEEEEDDAQGSEDDGSEDPQGSDEEEESKGKSKAKAKSRINATAAGYRRGIAYAKAVHEVCMLAGAPARAMEFITTGAAVADVRKTFLKEIAAGASGNIRTAKAYGATPDGKASEAEIQKGWDKAASSIPQARSRR